MRLTRWGMFVGSIWGTIILLMIQAMIFLYNKRRSGLGTIITKTTLSIFALLSFVGGCQTKEVVVLPPQTGSSVLVFRYDDKVVPSDHREDVIYDSQLIKKSICELKIGYHFQGFYGRTTLTISSVDVPEWKEMIEKLHASNELRYYTKYGFDEHGCGLAPL